MKHLPFYYTAFQSISVTKKQHFVQIDLLQESMTYFYFLTACQSGYSRNSDGSCTKCRKGTFSTGPVSTPTACTLCPDGRTTTVEGSMSCDGKTATTISHATTVLHLKLLLVRIMQIVMYDFYFFSHSVKGTSME